MSPENQPCNILIRYYQAMVHVEQKKAGLYYGLYTILFSLVSVIFGWSLKEGNKEVVLVIPFLISLWSGFALFNFLFLRRLREHIRQIENQLKKQNCLMENFVQWYSGPMENTIRKVYGSLSSALSIQSLSRQVKPRFKNITA